MHWNHFNYNKFCKLTYVILKIQKAYKLTVKTIFKAGAIGSRKVDEKPTNIFKDYLNKFSKNNTKLSVLVWVRMDPIGLYIWMLGFQFLEMFEKD